MNILFVHQNFPGQFLHLAPALAARGHDVLALTDEANTRPSPVRVVRYKAPDPVPDATPALARGYAEYMTRGHMAARGCRALRDRHGYWPDIIIGHGGWGETLLLREIWPQARLLVYAELMYKSQGYDVGFDNEFRKYTDEMRFMSVSRSAHLIQSTFQADAAISPTNFQADTFPDAMRDKITVIHDGIDTGRVCPDDGAKFTLPNGHVLSRGDPIVTYISRSLEPYRGFHFFMRALPQVLARHPDAQIVLVGNTDRTSYGGGPPEHGTWRDFMINELGDRLDLSRVHFLGRVPYGHYLDLLRVGRVHCYLTYPFVLSWSLTEAMAAGCQVLASDTAPVREVMRDGVTGRLLPFFDVQRWSDAILHALAGHDRENAWRQAAREVITTHYDLVTRCLPAQIAWLEAFAPDGSADQVV